MKNLGRYISENNSDYQNNDIGRLSIMDNATTSLTHSNNQLKSYMKLF